MSGERGVRLLLALAFIDGARFCEEGGGYIFKVVIRGGREFEAAPEASTAHEVVDVLSLQDGSHILVSEIAAIIVEKVT